MATNHTNQTTTAQWISHIRSLIARPIGGVPFDGSDAQMRSYIDGFVDELGNRRATDRPFLAYLLGIELDAPDDPQALDERLWWMIQSGKIDDKTAIGLVAPSGGLVADSGALAIEYRTMVELCALHALWVIALRIRSDRLVARCLDAAIWHTRELQPDNAINRPWATQVFIALSHDSDDPEIRDMAHLHAQTLVHNACVSFGAPDLLSGLILMDAANLMCESVSG